jgi:outer membrane protein assembly factor BamB
VASPIVYDGVVYTLSRKGELRGYTLEGDSCCGFDLGTAVEASFVAMDTTLYIGRIDGFVTALSLKQLQKTGVMKPLWEFETLGQISGSPNLVGDQLLVGSYDGSMYTLDNRTGRKTGQFETGYYINGTAAVWKNYMMFGGCDAWVRVVDIATGTQTDSLELDSYVPASPAILDGVACACDYNGNVYEMTLEDGKIASHRKLLASSEDNEGQDGGVVSMPTLTRTDVYILSGDRYISCINRATGQVRWRKMLRGMTGECSPLVAQDKVLVCTKDGHVSIFDSKDGTELWNYEAGEQIIASPAIIGDRFYILTSRGTLMCFN